MRSFKLQYLCFPEVTMQGTMLHNLHLLGTSLYLRKGQRVELTPATNLPQGGFFARPVDGKWADWLARSNEDSIHISVGDVEIDTPFPMDDAIAMRLTSGQIQQARDEGVTTALGLRRIEKNSRQAY